MTGEASSCFPEEIAGIVDDLVYALQNGKLAIFCGAGISFHPPANLPGARVLRKEILKHLLAGETLPEEPRILLEEGVIPSNGLARSGEGHTDTPRYFPFEVFIQNINKIVPILDVLVEIYKKGKPNKNHVLLVELMKRGYIREIMTTNFDMKLEEALEQVNTFEEKG